MSNLLIRFRFTVMILMCMSCLNAGRIIYPWNACTSLKTAGDSLEIWYAGEAGETIRQVLLQGPYNADTLEIGSVTEGEFVYDAHLDSVYKFNIRCLIPADLPMDLYDVKLITSVGTVTSRSALKVIKSYKGRYQFAHITDAHVGGPNAPITWIGDTSIQAIYQQEILRILNVIAPEYVLSTGDNIHDTPTDLALKWKN